MRNKERNKQTNKERKLQKKRKKERIDDDKSYIKREKERMVIIEVT